MRDSLLVSNPLTLGLVQCNSLSNIKLEHLDNSQVIFAMLFLVVFVSTLDSLYMYILTSLQSTYTT